MRSWKFYNSKYGIQFSNKLSSKIFENMIKMKLIFLFGYLISIFWVFIFEKIARLIFLIINF